MKKNRIITIGREFCSGGAETGRKLAENLGIRYIDKQIIDEVAETLKIDKDTVEHHDEKPVSIWEIPGYQYSGYLYYSDPSLMLPVNLRIAEAQFNAIRSAASKGPCVIVGRCADFVLKDIPNVLKVFIRADKSLRIQRAVRLYGLTEKDAAKLIKKTDNVRADYYRYHTGQSWSDAKNYNLVIDTGYTGTDIAAKIIEECLENPDIAGSTSV